MMIKMSKALVKGCRQNAQKIEPVPVHQAFQ